MKKMNKNDIKNLSSMDKLILSSVGSIKGYQKDALKIQKLMFFCKNSLPEAFEDSDIEFVPHKRGPYSPEIEEYIQNLRDSGLIKNKSVNLTNEGIDVYNQIQIKGELKSVFEDYSEFVNELTDNEIMILVYTNHPKYKSDSEYWDILEKDRLELATNMLLKGFISLSKASEIAEMNTFDYEKYLKNKNIRWRSID